MQGSILYRILPALLLGLLVSFPVHAQSNSQLSVEDAEGALRSGMQSLRAGDAPGAIAFLTPVIEAAVLPADKSAFALFYRAAAHQRLSQYLNAIRDYNQAIALDAMSPAVLAMSFYNRGLSFEASGKSSSALNDFSRALAINSAFAQAYNARGDIMRKLGRHQDAIRDYQASLRYRHPQPHLSLYGQALSHAALRQKALARSALERALVAKPDYKPARDSLKRLDQGGDLNAAAPRRAQEAYRDASAAGDGGVVTGSISRAQQTGGADQWRTRTTGNAAARRQARGQRVAGNNGVGATGSIPRAGRTGAYVPGPGYDAAARTRNTVATTAPAPPGTFLIQLTARRDEAAARNVWRQMALDHSDVLGSLTPYIQRVELGGRGTMYRLRAGPFAVRGDGDQVCRVLRARGADCFATEAGP